MGHGTVFFMKAAAKKRVDRHAGINVHFRAPDRATLERWQAAAKADGRSLNNWLQAIANDRSLPIKTKSAKQA